MGTDDLRSTSRRIVKAACPHDCPDTCSMDVTVENGVHAASGGQALTSQSLDFAALGRACAVSRSVDVAGPEAFADALRAALAGNGPQLIVLATQPDPDVVVPPIAPIALDPVLTKHRFMAAIGAPRYVPKMFGGGRLVSD